MGGIGLLRRKMSAGPFFVPSHFPDLIWSSLATPTDKGSEMRARDSVTGLAAPQRLFSPIGFQRNADRTGIPGQYQLTLLDTKTAS
jgi:hypothetical protein